MQFKFNIDCEIIHITNWQIELKLSFKFFVFVI